MERYAAQHTTSAAPGYNGDSGYRGPPMHDRLRKAREDMGRGNFSAANSSLDQALKTDKDLTDKQKERMLLLRAECLHKLRDDAGGYALCQEAMKVSKKQSPQPYFVAGRILLSLLKVAEAVEAFDTAEILMASPVGSSADLKENEELGDEATNDAWAMIGVDPRNPPDGPPPVASATPKEVPVTWEWAGDLEYWRKSEAEARALASMLTTHTIPRNVVRVGAVVLKQKLSDVARRSLVLVVQNETHNDLCLQFDHFFDGTFLANHTFPNVIKPGEVGIAAAHNNSWKGTVKGVVGFTFSGDDGVLCFFENPLMGNFRSEVKCGTLKNLNFDKSNSLGRLLLQEKSPVSTIVSNGVQYKAIAGTPTDVQVFTVTTVKKARMNALQVAGVLEFLPSFGLKKATSVCKEWRQICNNFPPQFYLDATAVRRSYPDYCSPMDIVQNPFCVPDTVAKWRITQESAAPYDRDDFGVFDSNGNRVLQLTTDLASRSLDVNLMYVGRKCPLLQLSENWMPLSKTSILKVPGGRTVGKLTINDQVMKLNMDATDRLEYTIRTNSDGSRKATECTVRIGDAGAILCSIQLLGRDQMARRNAPIAEVHMFTGCDALLCTMIAFYCRAKFAGSLF